VEGSWAKALEALTLHPLVSDVAKARAILTEFQVKHAPHFPQLQ
jgi:alpha-galactosidase/6-phospho-beta-glucosidase family protein